MKKMLLTSLLLVLGLTSSVASAEQYNLNYGDREIRGNGTLKLKADLQSQYGIDVNRYDLRNVMVIAKSYNNDGDVALKVGNDVSYAQRLRGNPRDYYNRDPRTFDRVNLRPSYQGSDNGVWQVLLRGNVIIRTVVVDLSPSYGPGPGPVPPGPGPIPPQPGYWVDQQTQFFVNQILQPGAVINISDYVRRDIGHLDPRNVVLDRILVMGKSYRGFGQIQLWVDRDASAVYNVPGNPGTWTIPDVGTMTDISIYSPAHDMYNGRDNWVLQILGNDQTLIHRIVVYYKVRR